jgi:hypothetical protein
MTTNKKIKLSELSELSDEFNKSISKLSNKKVTPSFSESAWMILLEMNERQLKMIDMLHQSLRILKDEVLSKGENGYKDERGNTYEYYASGRVSKMVFPFGTIINYSDTTPQCLIS